MSSKRFGELLKFVIYAAILIIPTWFVYSVVHGYVGFLARGAFLAGFTQFLLAGTIAGFVFIAIASALPWR